MDFDQLKQVIDSLGLQDFLMKVMGVIVLLFVAWVAAGWLGRLARKAMLKARLDETLTKFFSKFIRWAVLILALLACLGVFGVETTSFAAVIGAAGLAIGLAFQGTLGNFAAGIMLLMFRPFKVGDIVNVAGQTGKVDEIELFTTTIDTPDNRRIIIPNGSVFGSVIENISHHSTRRVDVAVGSDYSADLDATRDILTRVATNLSGRLDDPEPAVVLLELGGSSIDWSVRVWCNSADFWGVKQALTRDVKNALDQAGIGIPFPQMDVHMDQTAAS
ncbi:MAG: mechanosensitive ion channel domain-containing protein [Planctomycetota bacterium]|nr:mechanosensitive ion channel domain-containing protein [Planctomycetota bacterium]